MNCSENMLKKIKNIVLEELHRYTLNESLSDIVYHFTNIDALINILKTNKMFCQSILAGSADDMSPNNLFYISFTRNKSPYEGWGYHMSYGDCVRIEFDGTLLNQNFKGSPVNYWGANHTGNKWDYQRKASGVEDGAKNCAFEYEPLKDGETVPNDEIVKKITKILPFFRYPTSKSPNFVKLGDQMYKKVPLYDKIKKSTNLEDLYSHVFNEIEDRLFTNKSYINNALKYIRRIDVLMTEISDESKFPKNDFYKILTRFGYNKTYGRGIIYLYDNKKDFNFQTDNYINEKYLSLCDDIVDENHGSPKYSFEPDNVAKFFALLTYKEDIQKSIVYTAKTLRQYGFDDYVNKTINYLKNVCWWDISSLIINYCHNLSKFPSEIGQKVLQMFANLLRQHGYHNISELNREFRKYQNTNPNKKIDWNKIDDKVVKKFKCFELYGYLKYDITNDSETDIWYMLGLHTLRDRYYLIDRIMDDARYELPPTWIYNVRGNDEEKFKKYLQSLAHGKLTFGKFIQILKKIGFKGEMIKSYLNDPKIYTIHANWYDYQWKYNIKPPSEMSNEEEDLRVFNIFKKEDLEDE